MFFLLFLLLLVLHVFPISYQNHLHVGFVFINPWALRLCPCIPPEWLDAASISCMLPFIRGLFVHRCMPPVTFPWLPARINKLLMSLKVILENELSCTPFSGGVYFHKTLQSKSLNRPESVLLVFRIVILIFFFLPCSLVSRCWSTRSHCCSHRCIQFVLPCLNAKSSRLPNWLLNHLCHASMHSRKFVLCLCLALLPFQQMVNIPDKDQGLCMWGLL